MREPTDLEYSPEDYGKMWAGTYDMIVSPGRAETLGAVDKLAELALGGPVLEVAAGTGRIAIPLAQKGLQVTATDASELMIDKLLQKDAGHRVQTNIDVLPQISGNGRYSLICGLFNAMWVMPTAKEQRLWLRNAAGHLDQDGKLVVEMGAADPRTWTSPHIFSIGEKDMIRTSSWNPVTQKLLHRFEFHTGTGAIEAVRNVLLRVIFPNELLLMAELEGLYPVNIWSGWKSEEFGAASHNMVTVFKSRAQ